MANEKILNTRVQLKYDTLANWNASTFIPKKGEVCIATVDTAQKDPKGNIITVPTLLIKVGSGAEGATFSTLPFVSAPAADVYDWAKKSEAEFVAGFLNMKNGETTMQSLLDGIFATDTELTAAVAGLQGQIDAINTKLGDLSKLNTTYKTDLVGAINEALQAVEVGGTGSVVSVVVSDVEGGKSYQVTQGGNNVGSAIVVPDDTAAIADAKKAGTDAADALNTYKGEMTTALGEKANTADVYSKTVMDTMLAAKADKATVEQALEGKASTSALAETNAAVALKADKSYVDTELGKKADAEAMTTALAGKVDNATLTTELAKKQDVIPANTYDAYGAAAQVKSDIEGTLAGYSTTEQMNAELDKKVDKVEGKSLISDAEITRLASVTNYDDTAIKADIAKKADSATMTTELGKKVDKVEGYSLVSDTEIARLADVDNYDDAQVKADIAANTKAITDEVARAKEAEAGLSGRIDTLEAIDHTAFAAKSALEGEVGRATGAEEALAGRIKALEDVSHDFASADAALKAELQAEIDADVKALADGAVKANTEAIAAINDAEDGILATAKAYTDEVKEALLGTEELNGTYDTLKEIGAWIENSGVDATELSGAIAAETKAREDADAAINETIDTLATKEMVESVAHDIEINRIAASTEDFTIDLIDKEGNSIGNFEIKSSDDVKISTIEDDYGKIVGIAPVLSQDVESSLALANSALQAADIENLATKDEVKANTDAIAAINDTEDGILAQAKAYADGLADNYDAAGSAAQALKDAKDYADSLNHEDTKYTAAADGGLKLNADNSFAIDDSLVFVFDCGDASTKIN